jgi:cardiolipin synthase
MLRKLRRTDGLETMSNDSQYRWLRDGESAYQRMLAAIDGARESVCLETYIFSTGVPGDLFRAVLAAAARRGRRVEVLVDGFGSMSLPGDYWNSVTKAGGSVRVFNPLSLERLTIRNHRKLLVVDDRLAFVGGFNIAPAYAGDGVERGWCDFGMELEGPLAAELGCSFRVLYENHEFRHPRLRRWRKLPVRSIREGGDGSAVVLSCGPGFGRNAFHHRLLRDLATAGRVDIVAGYFVPSFRLRRGLRIAARRGAEVRLLLAGKSDVPLARRAGRSLYGGLLRGGVKIDEYQPQILHAKLAIVDDVVYAGSANLDARSRSINYEVMVRIHDSRLAEEGREIVEAARRHALPVSQQRQPFFQRLGDRWARFILTRVDPWVARRQLRRLD